MVGVRKWFVDRSQEPLPSMVIFLNTLRLPLRKIYDGGRFVNQADIDEERKVCVIGERTQKELFDEDEQPVGQYIRVDDIYFQVIGVHKYIEGGGFESDGDVFIPFSTYKKTVQYRR